MDRGRGVARDAGAPHEPDWGASAEVRRDPLGPMGKTSSLLWSLARDDAPNVQAGVPYLANYVTKVGRFGRIDPRKHGLLWNRWKWVGLLFWAGLVGGAFAKAWKDEGGLSHLAGDGSSDPARPRPRP